jgi:hypothetical protein
MNTDLLARLARGSAVEELILIESSPSRSSMVRRVETTTADPSLTTVRDRSSTQT